MAGSMDSKITQINPETGEVIEGVFVWMPKKRVSPFERHFTMNQAGLLTLAQNLTGEQLKVLLTLLADLDGLGLNALAFQLVRHCAERHACVAVRPRAAVDCDHFHLVRSFSFGRWFCLESVQRKRGDLVSRDHERMARELRQRRIALAVGV